MAVPSWNLGGRAEGLESPAALLGDLRCRLGLAWELLLNLSSCPGGEEGGATKAWRSLLLAPPPEPHPRQGVGPAGIWGLGCACPSKQCSILLHSSPTSLPALSKKGECRHTPPGGGGPRSVIPPLALTSRRAFRPLSPTPSDAPSAPAGRVGGGETRKEQTSPPGAIRSG